MQSKERTCEARVVQRSLGVGGIAETFKNHHNAGIDSLIYLFERDHLQL